MEMLVLLLTIVGLFVIGILVLKHKDDTKCLTIKYRLRGLLASLAIASAMLWLLPKLLLSLYSSESPILHWIGIVFGISFIIGVIWSIVDLIKWAITGHLPPFLNPKHPSP